MALRREPLKAVPTLLNWLDKTMARVEGINGINESNTKRAMIDQFKKVQDKLQDMKDLLPNLKQWEETFLEEFTQLEKYINEDIFDDGRQVDKINEKLKYIGESLKRIQENNDKIKLPAVVKKGTELQKQDYLEAYLEARKLSVDWVNLKVEEKVLGSAAMDNLRVSFDILDLQSKLCLLCFSIFPDKSVIKKRPLINWWIAEGFITKPNTKREGSTNKTEDKTVDKEGSTGKTEDKTADELGEEKFKELIRVGLIQPVHNKNSPAVNSCKMHPWVRRMLISVAKKAEFFDFDSTGTPANDSSRFRHGCLVSGSSGLKMEELLTLFNVNKQYLNLKAEWFSNLKKLVVLQLGRWQTSAVHIEVENDEFLKYLGSQKHLKYLSLHGISRITKLPSSLAELINLEILELRACHNLEKLPSAITTLRKLTHLDLSECYLLEGMPKGLEKLSSLQVLKGFLIGRPWSIDCKFADLAKLNKLRKLSICIGREATVGELDLDKLKDIKTLRILAITWERVASPSKNEGEQSSTTANGAMGEVSSESDNKSEQSSRTANPTMGKESLALKNEGEQSSRTANSNIGEASKASESKGEQSSGTTNSIMGEASKNKGEQSSGTANSNMGEASENKGEQSSETANSTMGEASENKGEQSGGIANSTMGEASEEKGEQSSKTANSTMGGEQSGGIANLTMGEASEEKGEQSSKTANSTMGDASENKGEQSSGTANSTIGVASEKKGEQSSGTTNSTMGEASENKGEQSSIIANSTKGDASENKGEQSSGTANSTMGEASEKKGEQSSRTANLTMGDASENKGDQSSGTANSTMGEASEKKGEQSSITANSTMGDASENKGEQSSGTANSTMGEASEKKGEQSSITANSTMGDATENKGEQSSGTANSTMGEASEKKGEQSSITANSTMGDASENKSEQLSGIANLTMGEASENKGEQSNRTANLTMGEASKASENKGEESNRTTNSTMGEASKASENKGEKSSGTTNSTLGEVPLASENKGEQSSGTANSTTGKVFKASENKGEQLSRTENLTTGKASSASEDADELKRKEKLHLWCLPRWRAKGPAPSASENKGEQSSILANSTKGEAEDDATWKSKISFPSNLEKLDLWCLPCWPDSLLPTNLKNLKRLYIRGGKLDGFPMVNQKWEVEILRLKYLNNLKVELKFLLVEFPKLEYLEKVDCHGNEDFRGKVR